MKNPQLFRAAAVVAKRGKIARPLISFSLLVISYLLFVIPASAAPSPYFIPSRTSGVAPLAVFFDAASSTAVSTTDLGYTTRPFHELDYQWDFGDYGAGTWTYGAASSSKNQAYGPMAAHVFETPGTYTVTLSVRNATTTAATSTTITVTDPNTVFAGANTICVAANTTPVAGSDGCPSGAQVFQNNDWDNAIVSYASTTNKRVLFKRGDTFIANTAGTINNVTGPVTIGAYGSGNAPVVQMTGNTDATNIDASSDIRMMDLEFDLQSGNPSRAVVLTGSSYRQLTFLRLNIHHGRNAIGYSGASTLGPDQIFVVDSVIKDMVGTPGYGLFLRGSQMGILGNLIDNDAQGEHNTRFVYVMGGAIGHNTLRRPNSAQGKANIKLHADSATTSRVVISGNHLAFGESGTAGGISIEVQPQTATADERLVDVIVERNFFVPLSASQNKPAIAVSAQDVTVRNNVILLSPGGSASGISVDRRGIEPNPTRVNIYNNTFYGTYTYPSGGNVIELNADTSSAVTNSIVQNNLGYTPNAISASTRMVRDYCSSCSNTISFNTTDTQLRTVSPLFVSTASSSPSDFRLQFGSYAIGTTTTLIPGVFRDFFGSLRDNNSDLGAIERSIKPYFIPSRTSGVAPLAVFFDTASSTSASTTATATERPFHELEYEWNFGDPNAGVWTYGTASSSKNEAYGPLAAHVYETPGTYTVTLNVYDGTYTESTTTQITVTDPEIVFSGTNTVCIANSTPIAGSGGCPSGAATPAGTSNFNAALSSCIGAGKRCLFKRGDRFTSSATVDISVAGPMTVGAYGGGALPLISATNTTIVRIPTTAVGLNMDLRIMDLEMAGSGVSDTGRFMTISATSSNILILRATVHDMGGVVFSGTAGPAVSGFGIVESHIYDVSNNNAFFGRLKHSALMGNSAGPILTAGTGEHVFRVQQAVGVSISHNSLRSANYAKSVLTVRGSEFFVETEADDTRNVYISDNTISGATNGAANDFLFQIAPSGSTQKQDIYDIIVERNYIKAGTVGSNYGIITEGSKVTIRNNIVDMTSGATGHSGIAVTYTSTVGSPIPDSNRIYHNTILSNDTAANFRGVFLTKDTDASFWPKNTTVKNNLAYAPNDSNHQMLYVGAGVTGTVAEYNSTDSQVKNTPPSFASTTPSYSETYDFKLNIGSYAFGTTTSLIPGVWRDFYNNRRPQNPSMGAIDISTPNLTTQAASSIAKTSATVNATIVATGGATSTLRGFVYGLSTAYTATSSESGSFLTGPFSSLLSNLTCNTLYHFAPFAQNSVGISYGSDATFTTDTCGFFGGLLRDFFNLEPTGGGSQTGGGNSNQGGGQVEEGGGGGSQQSGGGLGGGGGVE